MNESNPVGIDTNAPLSADCDMLLTTVPSQQSDAQPSMKVMFCFPANGTDVVVVVANARWSTGKLVEFCPDFEWKEQVWT